MPRILAENHATDCADGIGQSRPVFIGRLVNTVTLEEKTIASRRSDRELAEDLLAEDLLADDGEAATALSAGDREALLRPLGQET